VRTSDACFEIVMCVDCPCYHAVMPTSNATSRGTRRPTRLVVTCSLGLAAVGCAGNASPPGPPGITATALELRLPATHTHAAGGMTMQATWSMVANLAFDAAGGAGWLAIDGLVVDGQPAIDQPTTHAVAISGTPQAAGVAFAPFMVQLPGVEGSVSFNELVIDPTGDPFTGTAAGTFHQRRLDQVEDWAFRGDLTATADRTAPRAFAEQAASAPVALDPVRFMFSEPVDLTDATITAVTEAGPVPLATTPTIDSISGRAVSVTAMPQAYWPAGASVMTTLSNLVDVGGNVGGGSAEVTIGPVSDPSMNLGFESGMTGWLGRSPDLLATAKQEVAVDSPNGPPLSVVAPVGSFMGSIPAGASITGFLVPPSGAVSLSFELALINSGPVVNLQNAHRGLFIEIVTPSGSITAATGDELPRPTDPDARWTGFHTVQIQLPADAQSGFWLTVRAGAYEPPVNAPRVLVDDIRF
jgi:hypothetical protein